MPAECKTSYESEMYEGTVITASYLRGKCEGEEEISSRMSWPKCALLTVGTNQNKKQNERFIN